ncbi:MAG: CAP domain-containing protein [Rubripirellula sp.]
MRIFASFTAALILLVGSIAAQTPQPSTYLCPECGKIHSRSSEPSNAARMSATVPRSQPATTTGTITTYKVPVAETNAMVTPIPTGGTTNVLSMLNAQRGRQGISSLRYDPQLQAVAQRRVQQMAASGLKDHPPGSIAPGTHEGVGWSSSFSPSGVSACYTSDSRMQFAGAAMATGRDGVYFAVVYR